MKRKILYVPMHLSTGGSPQWLYEMLKVSMLDNEVFVAEFNNYGSYDIQKDKIIDLIGKKNHECIGPCFSDNWREEKDRLWGVIEEFEPDVIHFNEIPENFEYNGFPKELLEKIYSKDRKYKIFETCHDNSFDFSRKIHIPDAYVCVSDYHPRKIKETFPDAECHVWDYEIPKKERPNREQALRELDLDPGKFHVLNVGLFHGNKNQKFIYDIAEQMTEEEVQFHFIGNDCYLCNCGIEDTDLVNCKVWGERNDVDRFYSCMDLFLFPSLRELNPLSVKEALSWGMPVFMNRIESCDLYKKYENNPGVTFIDDVDTKKYIESKLKEPVKKDNFRIALYTSFYNNVKYVPGLYKQIQDQTYQDWKWFVTDDFSQDDAVRKALLDLASRDSRVIFCEQKSKKEMFWNAQHFVTKDCDYLALVDADDGIYPKSLEFLNHMLKKNPEAFTFSTWFHQYQDNVKDVSNITNIDFSFPQGDWYSYMNKHEEDLKAGKFDWDYLRTFRFFGALRGHKNIKGIEIEIDNPEKTVSEDSIRMSLLQKYGHYVLFPRPMYKVLNHGGSHATPGNMDEEQHRVSKNNLFKAIESGEQYQHNKILHTYYDFFNELCALARSNIHFEKDRKRLCLITNRPFPDSEKEKIQDLYFDHDFCENEFSDEVDYFFFDMKSFKEKELVEVFNKLKELNNKFEINVYCLMDSENQTDSKKEVELIRRASGGMPFSYNIFCKNLVFNFSLDQRRDKKKVLIEFCSSALGDCLSWIPYVEEYRKQNDCDVYLFTHKNELYRNSYPNVHFLDNLQEAEHIDFDKKLKVGWFKGSESEEDTPLWVKQNEQQRAGSYYLGLKHKELKPKVDVLNKERAIEGKYVCIGVQSTSQCKYWNNPTGWDQVIEYLNSKGYKVVCIDQHPSFGNGDHRNHVPKGAIDKTGDYSLHERITDLYNCEFFIGLGSGLSWLAWGLGKDVVLISGFSNENTEFYTPYRVINKDVCNSCWNRSELDGSNWLWCPDHEGTERHFECSKHITFEMVKRQINKIENRALVEKLYRKEDNMDWRHVLREVWDEDIYQKFFKVEDGDYVVDLGCSRGVFYFKNRHKNIKYLGVEAFSDNIDLFYSTLPEERDVTKLHNYFLQEGKESSLPGVFSVENEKKVIIKEMCFSSLKDVHIKTANFEDILRLVKEEDKDRKIDFLKFDAEDYEIDLFDKHYETILSNVRKFSGEVHCLKSSKAQLKNSKAIKLIVKLKSDDRVNLKITDVLGFDITDEFWAGAKDDHHDYYKEVLIHGEIL